MADEDGERPNRSVNDFRSAEELEQALKSNFIKRSVTEGKYVTFMDPALQEDQAPILKDEETRRIAEGAEGEALDPKLDWVLENFDPETTEAQSLGEEIRRLLVLKSYLILDSERQEAFERVTGLASRVFKCPMALISLVDLGRQWFMSNRGLGDCRETKRKYAFCAHAIMGKEDFLIVPDATQDFRFRENPLVTGPPHIRFYAGAPLISPEGYKLGTLCVLDTTPRPGGMTLEEKQNLMELAALAVQATVDHKRHKLEEANNPAQLIAYTAHDLLTPLTGVQLSLSLLMEDEEFSSGLTQQQREMITTASNCTDVMGRICQTAIDSFRKKQQEVNFDQQKSAPSPSNEPKAPVAISDFVKSLYMVLDPFPKQVPLIITVHPSVPDEIITDDLKVFRAAVNYLTNACAKTETGSVHLTITTKIERKRRKLIFECEDTGPGVPAEKFPFLFRPFRDESSDEDISCMRPSKDGGFLPVSTMQMSNSGLGLYSVAVHISSIGGEYGYRPRGGEDERTPNGKPITGSIFWFTIPLVVPEGGESEQGKRESALMRSFNSLNSSLRDLDEQKSQQERMVKVLSTPSMSEALASQVYTTFTKVLEEAIPSGIDDAFSAIQAAETAEAIEIGSASRPVGEISFPQPMKEAVPLKDGEPRQKKALVIEDSMVVRKSLTRVLTKLGFETVQAVDGMEGLKELQCTLFDVVLCDFLMPVMDGLDCVQQYRAWEEAHRPFFRQYIIGISAHANEKDISRGMEVGMDDFKPKPVTYKQLADLQKSDELKKMSQQLDEIAAAGTMMVDSSAETTGVNEQQQRGANSDDAINGSNHQSGNHFCLIATETGNTGTALIEKVAEANGWKTVIVHNGEDALRLMKMRNWDAILVDEELPVLGPTQCITRFREWEGQNRVNRQRNIVLLGASYVPLVSGSKSMVQLPFGFDGSLGKPIQVKEFEHLMSQATRSEKDFGVRDLVSR